LFSMRRLAANPALRHLSLPAAWSKSAAV